MCERAYVASIAWPTFMRTSVGLGPGGVANASTFEHTIHCCTGLHAAEEVDKFVD